MKRLSRESIPHFLQHALGKLDGVEKKSFDEFEQAYRHTLCDFSDLKKLLERSKKEEYPVEGFFSESAKDGNDSEENTPTSGELLEKLRSIWIVGTIDEFKTRHACMQGLALTSSRDKI